MSLLTVVQDTAVRCNYTKPSAVISSTDPNVQLMLSCVQDIGDELVERWGWQNLKMASPYIFTGDGTTTLFPLPPGWNTMGPSNTLVSTDYPTMNMPGPVNEEQLLRMKALPVVVTPSVWREVDNQIEFFPALALNENVTFVYAQNTWIVNPAGVPYPDSTVDYDMPKFQTDGDMILIKERLVMLGAVALWKRRKGFDYAEELEDYESSLDRKAGQETTTREIRMSRAFNVEADTFFPGTIADLSDHNF